VIFKVELSFGWDRENINTLAMSAGLLQDYVHSV
jgi:hypothetical protein